LSKAQKEEQIKAVAQKLSELRNLRDQADAEARGLADKRDKSNEQSRNFRIETSELRSKRDRLNEEVKDLKLQRSEFKERVPQKIEEIKKLKQERRELTSKKPSRNRESLRREVEGIDWKIQTTPLNMQEEKELVKQVKQLETQLNVYRKLESLNQKIGALQAEITDLETRSKLCHEKLTEIAHESQELHHGMLEKIDELKELKAEADNQHKLFLQAREKARAIQKEIAKATTQMKQLQDEFRAGENQEKKHREDALRKKLEEQIREKLKRGEKLSWEEFQLFAEGGMETQD
jgi:uncharacterized coiled-coil DUF342 family protein